MHHALRVVFRIERFNVVDMYVTTGVFRDVPVITAPAVNLDAITLKNQIIIVTPQQLKTEFLLIKRDGFFSRSNSIQNGSCAACGAAVAGVWG